MQEKFNFACILVEILKTFTNFDFVIKYFMTEILLSYSIWLNLFIFDPITSKI